MGKKRAATPSCNVCMGELVRPCSKGVQQQGTCCIVAVGYTSDINISARGIGIGPGAMSRKYKMRQRFLRFTIK
jgi:hypothetical protein